MGAKANARGFHMRVPKVHRGPWVGLTSEACVVDREQFADLLPVVRFEGSEHICLAGNLRPKLDLTKRQEWKVCGGGG